jgi:DNA polymerase-3 subunit delta
MTKALTCQQFLPMVATLKLQPGYLITGEDCYLTDKVLFSIKEIVKRTMPAYEQITLYGDELKVSELSEYLDSYSLFSDNRVIVIRNADRFGEEDKTRKNVDKQKKILELIADYLQNPEASQVLVIIADSIDARLTGWKRIKESCQAIECAPIKYAGEMKSWLEGILREHKKTMQPIAKDLFLSKVELDFCTAENEIEKLFIFVGENTNITERDVKTTLPTTRAGTIGDFYKIMGNRQSKEALLKINEMLSSDWLPLQILSNVTKFFLTIWKIQALKNKHISPSEITSTHLNDIFASYRNDYMAYSAKYKYSEIPKIFETILQTDTQLKLSMAEPDILLSICMINICKG